MIKQQTDKLQMSLLVSSKYIPLLFCLLSLESTHGIYVPMTYLFQNKKWNKILMKIYQVL